MQQQNYQQSDEIHTDSLRMRAALNERTINRLKDQLRRLKEKVINLQEEVAKILEEKSSMQLALGIKDKQLAKLATEKIALERSVQIRTHRHIAEQSSYLNPADKQALELKIQALQRQLEEEKFQRKGLQGVCKGYLNQLQRSEIEKTCLQQQRVKLQYRQNELAKKIDDLGRLYEGKAELLQKQNQDLKLNLEDAILELKMHQRKQQMDGLLTYQNQISTPAAFLKYSDHGRSTSHLKAISQLQTTREISCSRCIQLQQQLQDYEQMLALQKQRFLRIVSELQSSKNRCTTLQTIICNYAKSASTRSK